MRDKIWGVTNFFPSIYTHTHTQMGHYGISLSHGGSTVPLISSGRHHKLGLSGPNSVERSQRILRSGGSPPADSLQKDTRRTLSLESQTKPTDESLYIHASIQRKQLRKLIIIKYSLQRLEESWLPAAVHPRTRRRVTVRNVHTPGRSTWFIFSGLIVLLLFHINLLKRRQGKLYLMYCQITAI